MVNSLIIFGGVVLTLLFVVFVIINFKLPTKDGEHEYYHKWWEKQRERMEG